jgi:GntR family transcriptional regulator, rspAB operon transcriptional repressor
MPRKGVIVQPDSISKILKILDSRAAVEAELARDAAEQATPGAADELKALARRGYGNGNRPPSTPYTPGDRIFHGKFAQMSGNPVLIGFARSLHERSVRYWYLHLWRTAEGKATIRQHTAIADDRKRRRCGECRARSHRKLASAAAEGAESNAAP